GPITLTGGIHLIDRDDFARLRFLQHVVVMKAPPGRRIAPETLAFIRGVRAWSWLHVQDTHLEDVARPVTCDRHRSRADMYSSPLTSGASEQRGIDWPGAAPVHSLSGFVPVIDALDARITFDHTLVVIVGMVRYRLDSDEIPRFDLDQGRETLTEVAPVHG